MDIQKLETKKFGKFNVGDIIINEKYNKINQEFSDWYNKHHNPKDDSFYIPKGEEFYIKDVNGAFDRVTKIVFYPEDNKFEIMNNNEIVYTIISSEYLIKHQIK
jgi:hypothetical protein